MPMSSLGMRRTSHKMLIKTNLGTNYLHDPENLASDAWIDVGASVGSTGAIDRPLSAGLKRTQKLFEELGGSVHGVSQNNVDLVLTKTRFVASVYAKADERYLLYVSYGNKVFAPAYAWFDLRSGMVGTSRAFGEGIKPMGSGWYRCWVEGETGANGARVDIGFKLGIPNENVTYSGNGSSGLLLGGAMLELATGGPTAYSSTKPE